MNVKALLFGVLGMLIFGSVAVAWISNDMREIRAEERAELTKKCQSAAASPVPTAAAAAPGTASTPADATAAQPSQDLAERCDKIGVSLSAPTAGIPAGGEGVAPPNGDATGATAPQLAPLQAAEMNALPKETMGAEQPAAEAVGSGITAAGADAVIDAGTSAPADTSLPPRIGRTSSTSMEDPRLG